MRERTGLSPAGLEFDNLEYVGIDIVQALLDYAATKSPPHFRFVLNEGLSLPAADNSADMFIAFSVFTHLLHEESFLYLRDAKRVVKPGGAMVVTILESERNWPIFEAMVSSSEHAIRKAHLNMIVERSQMIDWARRLDLQLINFDIGGPHDGHGQTVAWLRRPE